MLFLFVIRHSSHIVANLKQFSYKTKYFNLFIEILNQNLMKKNANRNRNY